MKLIEQNNYDFKAQFDNPKWLHSIKCALLEQVQNPKYFTYKIKPVHITHLFSSTDNKFMTAAVNDQEILLELNIKTEGIYFECMYKVDFKSGEIDFEMYNPFIVKKEYVVPVDFEPDLAERVKKFTSKKFNMANFCDAEFNKYYSDKFIPVFIDYAAYLESLVKEENCKGCIYLYQHRLSGVCHYFYKKNESK